MVGLVGGIVPRLGLEDGLSDFTACEFRYTLDRFGGWISASSAFVSICMLGFLHTLCPSRLCVRKARGKFQAFGGETSFKISLSIFFVAVLDLLMSLVVVPTITRWQKLVRHLPGWCD